MNHRQAFEHRAALRHWDITRGPKGNYTNDYVQFGFIGYCMALGIEHTDIP